VLLIFIVVSILKMFGVFDAFWGAPITSGGIADANTIFNLAAACVLLPLNKVIENIATRLVKDDADEEEYKEDLMLDKAFYRSPELALSAAFNVIKAISDMIKEDAPIVFDLLIDYDEKKVEKINKDEDHINSLTDKVIDYLDQMPKIIDNEPLSNHLNYYVKCVMEYERIGDYIVNIAEDATELYNKGLAVSANAAKEVLLMKEVSDRILKLTNSAFIDDDEADAFRIEPLEETIDDLSESLKDSHLKRYNAGICSAQVGYIYYDVIANFEHIGDQCSDIGFHSIFFAYPDINVTQHKYVENLHNGIDDHYNQEYEAFRKEYYDKFEEINK
ncbi:MAG: Na/Pi cotransporter family protein, partial [Erysipelotrichaceae bacterium]|nr:Na/Pi cotransporter family protein [Erysipelotrichaceae bacterium]